MTPEEIKKIAQEVAKKIEPKKGYGGESYWIRTSTEIIEKIVEDCIIIPKSNVSEWKCIVEEALKADRVITAPAFRFMWESLFGKDTFEEEGK